MKTYKMLLPILFCAISMLTTSLHAGRPWSYNDEYLSRSLLAKFLTRLQAQDQHQAQGQDQGQDQEKIKRKISNCCYKLNVL